jgi:hypothetical protein
MNKPTYIGAIHTATSVQIDLRNTKDSAGVDLDMIGAKYGLKRCEDWAQDRPYPDHDFRNQILRAIVATNRKIWGGP